MQLPSMTDLGTLLAKSGYFQDARDMAQAVVKVLAGQELGFGPIASMTGVNIIKGKVALSANLMAASIKKSGRYNYRIVDLTETACTIRFFENGEPLTPDSTFTMADAKRAGLAGANWTNFPRNMLFARALSNGAKWHCPDLSGGPLYTPDELGATVDGETGDMVQEPHTTVPQPPVEPPPLKDVTPPPGPPTLPTVDEWTKSFDACQDQGALKMTWASYYDIRDQYNGEEQTAIMRAKDRRKVALSEAK
jgi:hypothetical protein